MPEPITAGIAAGGALLGLGSSFIGANAAEKASQAQARAAQAGIDEQRRQFDAMQQLASPFVQGGQQAMGGLQPYAQAGAPALAQQQSILGLGGPAAQQAAYAGIENSPAFQAMARQGEQAMLQNASATGGLRGGNTQAALAQFRPQLLNQLIDQQYARLGGMTALGSGTLSNLAQLGQASAANTGAAGMQAAGNVGNFLQQQGAAQSGGLMAQGGLYQGLLNAPFLGLGLAYAARGLGTGGGLQPGSGLGAGVPLAGYQYPGANFGGVPPGVGI